MTCLSLSFFVPFAVWLSGIGLLAFGLIWKTVYTRVA
jgi:hypothetical protein